MENYKISRVAKALGKSNETVRRWAAMFEDYLSSDANPGSGKTRIFTREDAEALTLVRNFLDAGRPESDIHAALQAGERHQLDEDSINVEPNTTAELELRVSQLTRQLEVAAARVRELEEKEHENIQLRTKNEMLEQQLLEAKTQIGELQGEMGALRYKLGRAEEKAGD